MLEVWFPLLVCLALGATWYHVLRLRELATAHARRLCERHGLQLLDDSVGLHRLRARWRRGSLHVMREYRFDTSRGGGDRQPASIILLGNRIVGTRMPSHEHVSAAPTTTPVVTTLHVTRGNDTADNVIPLDRARRTLH